MKYKLVVFDMDGTLADTSCGIINSHRYAHRMMGLPEPSDKAIIGIIGGPLLQTYKNYFRLSDRDARKAVEFYRDYYAERGIYEASTYQGIPEILQSLKSMGLDLGIATLKAERFVKVMLEHMHILDCFSAVYGMDDNDGRSKAQMIRMCMDCAGVNSEETVLVGDSIHDLNGARACGVYFLGATYGFGFAEDAGEEGLTMCRTPWEVLRALAELNQ